MSIAELNRDYAWYENLSNTPINKMSTKELENLSTGRYRRIAFSEPISVTGRVRLLTDTLDAYSRHKQFFLYAETEDRLLCTLGDEASEKYRSMPYFHFEKPPFENGHTVKLVGHFAPNKFGIFIIDDFEEVRDSRKGLIR